MKLFLSTLFFILIGCGCASKLPEMAPCSPPAIYLQEIPEPSLKGDSNHYLALYILDLKESLRLSNADKKALRDWADLANIRQQPTKKPHKSTS
jgi:hypothetical protein